MNYLSLGIFFAFSGVILVSSYNDITDDARSVLVIGMGILEIILGFIFALVSLNH